MYKELLQNVTKGKNLSAEQVEFFLQGVKKGKLDLVQQAAILSGLNVKGVSAQELSAFIRNLAQECESQLSFPDSLDICGTGGSGLPRINTSTISAFILSALGLPIAKHGNKAASGRFGSFDLLETLGVNIGVKQEKLAHLYPQLNLALLYARSFHPVMKHFAPVRKALQVPTVFNIIGPLLNPAGAKRQLIGTSFADRMELIVQTAKKLGKKQVMVVRGEDGLDEVTLTGRTKVMELKDGKIRRYTIKPSDFGVKKCSFGDISGGTAKKNTQIALEILKGNCKTRHLDLVLVNAALALKLAGRVRNLKKGYQLAKECVTSGRAYQHFLAYRQASHAPSILLEIAAHKRQEVARRKSRTPLARLKKKLQPSQRDFRTALVRSGVSLIAEVKKASPSAGRIKKGVFNPAKIAEKYEQSGARAISVLTDEKYFGGKLENLEKVRAVTHYTPLLCKDFIIDEYQIYEARKAGADAILLIAALLTTEQIGKFLKTAKSLNMDCLCEVHDQEELEKVLQTDADIIGINNRNLHTFKVDLKTTQKLSRKVPTGKILVAESGISTRKHVRSLPKKADAILVGSSLMKAKDLGKKVEQLIGKPAPLVKICGVGSVEEAELCVKSGADFIGLNFVPTSTRRISYQMADRIIKSVRKHAKAGVRVIGVFQDHKASEVKKASRHLDLDYIQFSGEEKLAELKQFDTPIIKGVSVRRKSDVKKAKRFSSRAEYILLDGRKPGSGQSFDHRYLDQVDHPYFLAGGITPENVKDIVHRWRPYGIDVASGVETNGERDLKKVKKLINLAKS